ncbi:DUF3558 domain-containing protein [Nocardia colli]|uniref:DUF3558 domain-containing protein n=1 Tax=Nocardia colli TaxID=2545717 RepID=UPI0035E180DE
MTSRGSKLRGIALVVGVGLVLAGCEKTTDRAPTGTGVPSSTGAASTSVKPSGSKDPDAAIWDPCTALPDDALRAGALSPDTRTKDVSGIDPTGWKVCGWRSSARWYTLAVASGAATLEQFQARPEYEQFTATTVAGHPAVRFLDAGDEKRLDCGVAVEVPQGTVKGTVYFYVITRYSVGKLGEPCDEATRHANEFAKFLPGGN